MMLCGGGSRHRNFASSVDALTHTLIHDSMYEHESNARGTENSAGAAKDDVRYKYPEPEMKMNTQFRECE